MLDGVLDPHGVHDLAAVVDTAVRHKAIAHNPAHAVRRPKVTANEAAYMTPIRWARCWPVRKEADTHHSSRCSSTAACGVHSCSGSWYRTGYNQTGYNQWVRMGTAQVIRT